MGAEEINKYRPISLIHAIGKMLASQLAPLMNDLVSNEQSAFLKKRRIHDKFVHVRNIARRLHKSKIHTLLFKLDIYKAFDSVSWEFILELLKRHGFPPLFRDWIASLLCTSSSWVLLNSIPGAPIKHGRGLRQGDPLSPLLFVLAIHPLQQIPELATQHNLLHKIRDRRSIMRTSLYADDADIFVTPLKEEIQNLSSIPAHFGEASGLVANFQKAW
jgi:hypothetical protein